MTKMRNNCFMRIAGRFLSDAMINNPHFSQGGQQ